MKRKCFAVALLAAVMMLCVGFTASAEEECTGYDRKTGYASVSGQTGWSGILVTLEVLKPDRKWTELETSSQQALEMLAYFNQIKTDAAGNFSISWKMEGVSGEYPIRIYNEAEKAYRELRPILYVSQTDIDRKPSTQQKRQKR